MSSYAKRKGRSKTKIDRFLMLPHKMTHSEQFRMLSGNELKVLLEIGSRFSGGNNGAIYAGLQDLADKLHLSKSTVSRAQLSLEARGFIACRRVGRFQGHASAWAITFQKENDRNALNTWEQIPPRSYRRKPKPETLVDEIMKSEEYTHARAQKLKGWYQNDDHKHP